MASIDEEIKSKFQNNRHRFLVNLMYTSSWVRNLFDDFLKPYGISNQQFNILRILRGANDWVTMNKIKQLMVEKSPNTTRLVDKLYDKNLIVRERSSEDRRVIYINITEKGLELLSDIDKNNVGEHHYFMNRITEEDAENLSKVLDKLRG